MSTKMWTTGQAPLRQTAGTGQKLLNIPPRTVVDFSEEEVEITYQGKNTTWLKVTYRDKTGWSYASFFEKHEERYPDDEVQIDNKTPNTDDFEQYFYYEGRVKHNMCGQLCVAWILGKPVVEVLESWKVGSPPFYLRIFGGLADRGTNTNDLDNLFSQFDFQTPCLRFGTGLKDPVLGRPLVTPRRMEKKLETHQLISSVHMDRGNGNLRGGGALHWVVVDRVIPNGVDRGFVELYNPAPNRVQLYSWSEYIKSAGSPYGVWVPRRQARVLRDHLLTI